MIAINSTNMASEQNSEVGNIMTASSKVSWNTVL